LQADRFKEIGNVSRRKLFALAARRPALHLVGCELLDVGFHGGAIGDGCGRGRLGIRSGRLTAGSGEQDTESERGSNAHPRRVACAEPPSQFGASVFGSALRTDCSTFFRYAARAALRISLSSRSFNLS